MDEREHYYNELVAPQFLVSLLASEMNVSDYAIFESAYQADGYHVTEEFLDDKFHLYMMRQHVPEHIARYCRKVLLGKAPFNGSKGCFLLA